MPKTIRTTVDRQPDGSLLIPQEMLADFDTQTVDITVREARGTTGEHNTLDDLFEFVNQLPEGTRSFEDIMAQVKEEKDSWDRTSQ